MTDALRVAVLDASAGATERVSAVAAETETLSFVPTSDASGDAFDALGSRVDVCCIGADVLGSTADATPVEELLAARGKTAPAVVALVADADVRATMLDAGVDEAVSPDASARSFRSRLRRAARHRQVTCERSLYGAVVETMDDGAHLVAPDGERVFFNRRAAEVHGLPADELAERAPEVFRERGIMDDETLAAYEESMHAVLSGERDRAFVDVELETPAGSTVAETRLTRVEASDPATGEFEGVVGVTRDVTARVTSERELERTNERLGQLARFFSHDLRNPLNVASGYAELARREGTDEQFDRLQTALDRMDGLVGDLLVLLDEDERTVRESVHLPTAARHAWETVETADATLVVESDKSLHASPSNLRRLLENAFGNAVTHGGSDVTVTVRDTADGFVVDDDGHGIPAEIRETLFETGVSGDGGTGLGLAIVATVAEQHDWTVAFEDSIDGGARLRVGDVDVDGVDASQAASNKAR
ncbi:hypothetical protein AUR64_14975 [Haloprofundus marisrubri]|uniref:histidine kinase n=1 Tax=Haloprofundus marisrubri TaxID=1514971 RepID=A0A0W1R6R3_9EURY|nr:PAS domain-containing sensor histidine kinase [Haloprofundus marisrubri]KTG09098.1 hypothetical protein AUR64_14975 [Haloprofundus marisrubri]